MRTDRHHCVQPIGPRIIRYPQDFYIPDRHGIPMKKLSLVLDALRVESFATTPEAAAVRGTIRAASETDGNTFCGPSCELTQCLVVSCGSSCEGTCGDSCHGTCIGTSCDCSGIITC